jgi:hypothetical protein
MKRDRRDREERSGQALCDQFLLNMRQKRAEYNTTTHSDICPHHLFLVDCVNEFDFFPLALFESDG